jgi:hypothetical protein
LEGGGENGDTAVGGVCGLDSFDMIDDSCVILERYLQFVAE